MRERLETFRTFAVSPAT
uniref:Gag-pol polyprotein n=1 Tax=Triatoma infestans TaxID=30076 RepID=A0A161MCP6_TRIIF